MHFGLTKISRVLSARLIEIIVVVAHIEVAD